MSPATLIQISSFAHNNSEQLLLPFFTSFTNRLTNLAPQTQTQKQTLAQEQARSLFGYHYHAVSLNSHRLRALSSTTHEEATSATSITEGTNTRIPISEYLVERLGFSKANSLVISKKIVSRRKFVSADPTDLISFEKADIVIRYLQDENECGLDLSHVKKVVTKCPHILVADVDKTIKPKIKLLQDMGFSTSDLAQVLSTNPYFYLERDLTNGIQFLRDLLGSHEGVVKVFKRLTWGSAGTLTANLIPNVTMLENEYGIPRDKIRKFLLYQPSLLFLIKTESLRDGIVKIEDKWGISRDSAVFLKAVHALCGLSDENVESKFEVFRSFGWSEDDILTMVQKTPNTLEFSVARLKKALEFYTNELGFEPAYLASQSALFGYNLENRVVPRHEVLLILKDIGFVKPDYQLLNAVKFTEYQFFDKFVFPYVGVVPNLRETYINSGSPTEEIMRLLETSGIDSIF